MAEFRLSKILHLCTKKNLFVPQTSDLLEKLALIFLYNFHSDHILLKLKMKKLLRKINVKNIKTRNEVSIES